MDRLQPGRIDLRFLVAAFDRLSAAHLSGLLREDVPDAEIVTAHSAAELEIAIAEPYDLIVLDTRNIEEPGMLVETFEPLVAGGCRLAAIVIDEMPEHLRWAVNSLQRFGFPHGILPATMTPAQCRSALVRVATGQEYSNWALRGARGLAAETPVASEPLDLGAPATPELASLLTPREAQILQLLKQGLRNKEVADRLAISINTAKIHIASIKRKYRVSSRMQLL